MELCRSAAAVASIRGCVIRPSGAHEYIQTLAQLSRLEQLGAGIISQKSFAFENLRPSEQNIMGICQVYVGEGTCQKKKTPCILGNLSKLNVGI